MFHNINDLQLEQVQNINNILPVSQIPFWMISTSFFKTRRSGTKYLLGRSIAIFNLNYKNTFQHLLPWYFCPRYNCISHDHKYIYFIQNSKFSSIQAKYCYFSIVSVCDIQDPHCYFFLSFCTHWITIAIIKLRFTYEVQYTYSRIYFLVCRIYWHFLIKYIN